MTDSSPAARLTAALADRYKVERELGQGGMATVYLAEDLKHHRKVAIKVLRPELAAALGADRFLREIETTANLRHPHILPLYDSGESAGFLFYVMPFVEGESLRDRLDREKQLPLDDALLIAREVADALSYAHSHGIVHRDIKPENILLESGHAVVADFGIARAVSAAGGSRLTATGMSVGTPMYMSPEQAAGEKDLDGRSDLYSLACVLYEMLTSQPPFTGPTVESVVHQHLVAEARPVSQLRPAVPPVIADVLTRALAKNPADRFSPAAHFAAALVSPAGTRSAGAPPRLSRTVLGLGVVVALTAIGTLVLVYRRPRAAPAITIGRTTQVTREAGLEVDPALSPDGSLVAYAAGPPAHMQIFVRQVGGGRTIALTTDSAQSYRWPRWSPDGSQIAYQGGAGIAVVPALGGQPRLVVRLQAQPAESTTTAGSRLAGFAWSPDGRRIAYSIAYLGNQVTVVPVEGGAPTHLAGMRDVHSLAWSPDGARLAGVAGNPLFVFGGVYFGNEGPSSIWVLPLDGSPPIRVTDDQHLNMSPQWAADGRHLFWVSDRDGSRDVYRIKLSGEGAPAGEPERLTTGADAHTISLSADGRRLAYARLRTPSNIWSISVPTTGAVSIAGARPVTTGDQTIETIAVSRDGRWLVFDSDRNGNADIYRIPAAGGEPIQLTTDSAGDYSPAWSPDGRRIAFHSMRTGNRDLFTMDADGSGLVQRTSTAAHELDVDWSRDGNALVATFIPSEEKPDSLAHTWPQFVIVPLGGGAERPIAVFGDFPHWSPSQDLIAFHSPEGLRVTSPGGTSRLLVPNSPGDGEPFYAAWSSDGKTVYYVAHSPRGSAIRAVPVTGGPSRLLVRFDDPTRQHTRYGFTTDGRTFYLTIGSPESDIWVAELEEK
ncbi:MAG: protein kinase [Gemmatimonadota bacterium]